MTHLSLLFKKPQSSDFDSHTSHLERCEKTKQKKRERFYQYDLEYTASEIPSVFMSCGKFQGTEIISKDIFCTDIMCLFAVSVGEEFRR